MNTTNAGEVDREKAEEYAINWIDPYYADRGAVEALVKLLYQVRLEQKIECARDAFNKTRGEHEQIR